MSPASANLSCWKCGEALPELPMPLGRREECPACGADLHACRMCEYFDPGHAHSCREPVADEVKDKERANFCGYFSPDPHAHRREPGRDDAASRAALDELFGAGSGDPEARPGETEADRARRELDALFGLDDPKRGS